MSEDLRLKYVIVARSGSGKTTMASILESQLGLRRCVTSTTRPPRAGEVAGRDYYFCTELDRPQMFESAVFGGFWYGTRYEELKRGDFIILDPQGVAYFRAHYPAPLTVIQLERSGIHVDAARIARDKDAGFDDVQPDYIVRGETIEEMSGNLIALVRALESQRKPSLPAQIRSAEQKQRASGSALSKHTTAIKKEIG